MSPSFKKLRFLLIGILVVMSLILYCWLMGLKINLTASMPIGFYQQRHISTLERGDIVSFCLPKPIALIGKWRGYIGNGICLGNTSPLLKELIALPGDKVVLDSQFIYVNGKRYFAPQQILDHSKNFIFRWIKNKRYKNNKCVWVYGSDDPIHSWDSRYFGPISVKNILGIYKPLWVFSHD